LKSIEDSAGDGLYPLSPIPTEEGGGEKPHREQREQYERVTVHEQEIREGSF
jgi:hypothetical protein